MKLMPIGAVARRTGVQPSALRYYEDQGILPAAQRVGGRRHYTADSIRMIEALRFAQQAGFTLTEIKTLFHGFEQGAALSARWRSLARSKLEEVDALVARAERMRSAIEAGLRCGCINLENCALVDPDHSLKPTPHPCRPDTFKVKRYSANS